MESHLYSAHAGNFQSVKTSIAYCGFMSFNTERSKKEKLHELALVTQPMLQRRPNRTELRLMDSYIQILCRLEGCFGPLKFESRIRDVCS